MGEPVAFGEGRWSPTGKPRAWIEDGSRLLRQGAQEVLDLLFPIACVGCGSYAERHERDAWICRRCREELSPDYPTCTACGAPAPSGRTCFPCLRDTALAGTLAVGPYRDPTLQNAIKRLKFSGTRSLAKPLGELLARRSAARLPFRGQDFVLSPVPLSRRRERHRGYNQAQLLADAMSAVLDRPVEEYLRRVRHTRPQTSLLGSAAIRRANVHRAFELNPTTATPLATKILLVDDVLTTGATLNEAAATLARHGAQEIWGAVVARGK